MMKFTKKLFKWTCTALWWLLLLATALLLVHILSAKVKGQVPKLFGHSVMQVVTGSMEPQIPVGTFILVRECDPAQIQPGDIITFYAREIAIYGKPNTHRVVEVTAAEGEYIYITKGDSNYITDTLPVSSKQLIGIYAGPIPWLTAFSAALDRGLSIVILAVVLLGITGMTCWSALRKKPENEALKEGTAYDETE